jgi:pyridoxamine 5'-phosphate oxidase
MAGIHADDDLTRKRLRALPVFTGDAPCFDPGQAPEDPSELFARWLAQAIDVGVCEPHAMTLSTIDAEGRPNARTLILKGLERGLWQFASSRRSPKGRELSRTPWAAATFYWPQVGRQVRLRGQVFEAGREESAADFLARSEGGRAEALVGRQSEILEDSVDQERALEEARASIRSDPERVPEHWLLYELAPAEVEFFQADRGRRHTRLRYRRQGGGWLRVRLWP